MVPITKFLRYFNVNLKKKNTYNAIKIVKAI